MILLDIKGKITVANDKTNLIHRFDVPENLKALKISYEYSPKLIEDRELAIDIIKKCIDKYDEELIGKPAQHLPIKNLVTISVDCCGEYIGAAHRQDDKQEHIICANGSSVGFEDTEIIAGEWDIMLNVHSVSCDVDYKLRVEGVE